MQHTMYVVRRIWFVFCIRLCSSQHHSFTTPSHIAIHTACKPAMPTTIHDIPNDILVHHIFPQVNCESRWHILPLVCKAWHASLRAMPSPAWHTIDIPRSSTQPSDAFRDKLRHLAGACRCLTIAAGQPHVLAMVVPMVAAMHFTNLHTLRLHSTLSLTMVKVVCQGLLQLRMLALHLTIRSSDGANASDYNMAALARLQQLQVWRGLCCGG